MLDELKHVPARAFEAVDESSLMVNPNSGAVKGSITSSSPSPRPTPSVTARPTTTQKPVPTKRRTALPVSKIAAAPTREVAAAGNQAERDAPTSIELWLITATVGAAILAIVLSARQKSKRPTK
jgi:hypothetical protein